MAPVIVAPALTHGLAPYICSTFRRVLECVRLALFQPLAGALSQHLHAALPPNLRMPFEDWYESARLVLDRDAFVSGVCVAIVDEYGQRFPGTEPVTVGVVGSLFESEASVKALADLADLADGTHEGSGIALSVDVDRTVVSTDVCAGRMGRLSNIAGATLQEDEACLIALFNDCKLDKVPNDSTLMMKLHAKQGDPTNVPSPRGFTTLAVDMECTQGIGKSPGSMGFNIVAKNAAAEL